MMLFFCFLLCKRREVRECAKNGGWPCFSTWPPPPEFTYLDFYCIYDWILHLLYIWFVVIYFLD